ncbi:unnamed protein product [Ambrosiozyma monospora]|uniref:Unnamed protein product n=1 Tax=Ambrosiozyma monospora TaxID=43982 RepID=A0A9W6YVQ9_AMBMO|nr:unnamed protein product [Ambrosiozyma monospora]
MGKKDNDKTPSQTNNSSATTILKSPSTESNTSGTHIPSGASPITTNTGSNNSELGNLFKRRSVACKACHSLKVKCVPVDPAQQFGVCIRCKKGNKHCEFDLSNVRKKKPVAPKSSKTQLKDLEAELLKLKKELQEKNNLVAHQNGLIHHYEQRQSKNESTTSSEKEDTPATNIKQTMDDSKRTKFEYEMNFLKELNETSAKIPPTTILSASEKRIALSSEKLDTINADMVTNIGLTNEQCERMLHLFLTKVHANFPVMALPENLSIDYLRQNEPLLLTLMCYISTVVDTEPSDISLDIQLRLESTISQTLAVDALVIGSKTVHLLKAMLLYCFWYLSPELFHHRRYHMFVILCVTIINDLGLTGRPYYTYSKEEGAVMRNPFADEVRSLEMKSIILPPMNVNTSWFRYTLE